MMKLLDLAYEVSLHTVAWCLVYGTVYLAFECAQDTLVALQPPPRCKIPMLTCIVRWWFMSACEKNLLCHRNAAKETMSRQLVYLAE